MASQSTVNCSRPPWPIRLSSARLNVPHAIMAKPASHNKWKSKASGQSDWQTAACFSAPHVMPSTASLSATHVIMAKRARSQSKASCQSKWQTKASHQQDRPTSASLRASHKWQSKASHQKDRQIAVSLSSTQAWSSAASKAFCQNNWPTAASLRVPHIRSSTASLRARHTRIAKHPRCHNPWSSKASCQSYWSASAHFNAPHANMANPSRCLGASKRIFGTVNCHRPPSPVKSLTTKESQPVQALSGRSRDGSRSSNAMLRPS
jgi:hypothetical protein